MRDTREKLIDEAIAHFDYGVTHDIFSEPVTTYAKLAGAALAYIRHVPDTDFGKWIPVSERLPESGQHVLCVLKNGGLDICQWCSFDKSWSNDHDWCQEKDVTHWMPLPELPKGE